jgi:hypothetical protein
MQLASNIAVICYVSLAGGFNSLMVEHNGLYDRETVESKAYAT